MGRWEKEQVITFLEKRNWKVHFRFHIVLSNETHKCFPLSDFSECSEEFLFFPTSFEVENDIDFGGPRRHDGFQKTCQETNKGDENGQFVVPFGDIVFHGPDLNVLCEFVAH